ncbi:cell division protein ftsk [hydrocarbon metagenome]|uniref:Cell division protein ftsk n=1 Tax=hydrocarbon metagenome TaxID=938273 RepID=A0A0W8FW28_9ZZZZ
MAKRKPKQSAKQNGNNYFIISVEKKKKLFGLILSVLAMLIFLSILSFSKNDQSLLGGIGDFIKVFSPSSEFSKRISGISNWLGIFGAHISYFLIHSTIGFASIIFPVIMFIWGYTILRNEETKTALYLSNFFIVIGLIFSAFFGLLRNAPEFSLLKDSAEFSGKIGDFFGILLGNLLGGLGSLIFLITATIITLIISFDIKFTPILEFFKKLWDETFEKKEKDTSKEAVRINKPVDEEEPESNLEKIKKLRHKPDEIEAGFTPGKIDLDEAESAETKIRILQKDEPEGIIEEESKVEDPYVVKEDKTKTEKEKAEEDSDPVIDKMEEAKLPEQWEEEINYDPPKLSHLEAPKETEIQISEEELKHNAELLKEKLSLFDIAIEDISVTPGPVVTLYEIVPSPGVKISRIVSLEHDIALALAARGIRIIAPIPGKSAIGVEIPNAQSQIVKARSVIAKLKESKAELPLALGKTISGDVYITDLATMPHLLIAGSTGSGKSVGINMILTSLIYAKHPSEIKFVIIDPKKIELSFYKRLNRHFLAVSPDIEEEIITNPQNALLVLKAVEFEMEKRYDKLAKIGVRNIVDYNARVADPKRKPKDSDSMKHYKMPYIIVVIDELADLMMTSGKEVEEPIARLAQLARAVGIHLIVATQRPSVNVITGVIKANFSARIAYQVATKIDSRTILDMNGAEQLLGRGDMLFLPGGMPKPIRIQNAFITSDEIEEITKFIYVQDGYSKRFMLPSMFEKKSKSNSNFITDLDDMFDEAARLIVRHQQGSVSLLQRRLKLGYARAARIVDQLEQAGVVGPSEGSKAREVLVENEEQLEMILRSL